MIVVFLIFELNCDILLLGAFLSYSQRQRNRLTTANFCSALTFACPLQSASFNPARIITNANSHIFLPRPLLATTAKPPSPSLLRPATAHHFRLQHQEPIHLSISLAFNTPSINSDPPQALRIPRHDASTYLQAVPALDPPHVASAHPSRHRAAAAAEPRHPPSYAPPFGSAAVRYAYSIEILGFIYLSLLEAAQY